MITYTEKIALTPEITTQLKAGQIDPKLLEGLLSDAKILYTLILDYEYGKGNLQNVQLTKDSLLFNNEFSGKLNVTYDINEFSVCSAIDFTGAYAMTLDFVINPKKVELKLTGEERYE